MTAATFSSVNTPSYAAIVNELDGRRRRRKQFHRYWTEDEETYFRDHFNQPKIKGVAGALRQS